MIRLQRTTAEHPDFIKLVQKLDAELAERDGPDHAFYAQFNKTSLLQFVVVAYENEQEVGSGALKPFEPKTMEIKRMYTRSGNRGKGIATRILTELETWAAELGYEKCILETGEKQPEAIGLYKKNGYREIPNYGQYAGVENSLCFEKRLVEVKKT